MFYFNVEGNCDLFVYDVNKVKCNQFSCRNNCNITKIHELQKFNENRNELASLKARIKRDYLSRKKRQKNSLNDDSDLIDYTLTLFNATNLNKNDSIENFLIKSNYSNTVTTSLNVTMQTRDNNSSFTSTISKNATKINTSTETTPVTLDSQLSKSENVENNIFEIENSNKTNSMNKTSFLFDTFNNIKDILFSGNNKTENYGHNIGESQIDENISAFYYVFLVSSIVIGTSFSALVLIFTLRFCINIIRRRNYEVLSFEYK